MKTAPNAIARILAETSDKMGAFGHDDPSAEQVVLKVLDELLMQAEVHHRPPDQWSRWEVWAFEILRESNQRTDGAAMTATLANIAPPR